MLEIAASPEPVPPFPDAKFFEEQKQRAVEDAPEDAVHKKVDELPDARITVSHHAQPLCNRYIHHVY